MKQLFLILSLYLFLASPLFAYEDIDTDYTETGDNQATVSANDTTVTLSSHETRLDPTRIYKDFGADYFDDGFMIQCQFNFSSIDDGALGYTLVCANGTADIFNLVTGGDAVDDYLWVGITRSGSTYSIGLNIKEDATTIDSDTYSDFSTATTYYLTLIRSGNAISLLIHTGSHTGTLVDTLSISGTNNDTYRYLHVLNSFHDDTTSTTISGTLSHFTVSQFPLATKNLDAGLDIPFNGVLQ